MLLPGQDHPRARMSALSAVVIWRAVQASRSSADRVSASQMWPGWTLSRPTHSAMTPAASFWVCSGRGVVVGLLDGDLRGGRVRPLGEFLPR